MIKTSKYSLCNDDCLNILPKISTKIDLILTDPPYEKVACKWDILIPFDKMWDCLYNVKKENSAIILFSSEPFTSHLILSNEGDFRQKLTWLKTRPTNVFNAKKQFMNWTEDICVFYEKLPTYNPIMRTDGQFTGVKIQRNNSDRSEGHLGKTGEKRDYVHQSNNGLFYPKSVLEFSNVHHNKEHYHPTQKPVPLLEYLIKTYSNDGDTVLDFTMGSGSTGVACMNLNRKFIGIEKEKKYFDIAVDRIEKSIIE